MELMERLFELHDEKYKRFSSKLTKTKYSLIGVKIPLLKRLAKELKDKAVNFGDVYFEEVMLEGLMIGYQEDINVVIDKLKNFIHKIDDWSVCDSCCANLKITKKNKSKMWEFVTSLKGSNKEFELRFMIVMMMDYYLDNVYIDKIFDIVDSICDDFYYSNMALSWLIATALVKCEKETLDYLNRCSLNKFVFNKAISKACESYRVSETLKETLKKMKR